MEVKQLGDFIKGRLMFLKEYCREHRLDPEEKKRQFFEEALNLAKTQEQKAFLQEKVFGGVILSTTLLPDWVDKILLEAMTYTLQGKHAPSSTKTSRTPCIPFEAGRFNAKRQAETVFRLLFQGKKPAEFLKKSFPILYQKCYGDKAFREMKVEEKGPHHIAISLPNRLLEKGNPMDCSTIIGYIYGSLEALGAKNILVEHPFCSTQPKSPHPHCVFEVTWQE